MVPIMANKIVQADKFIDVFPYISYSHTLKFGRIIILYGGFNFYEYYV